ncbi:HET-domain-containing protein [Apiospora marii]|uniref:HET-domain-containing protein n=1 Tax=Apiospora marii TaxID=335849 RepID=A0ABR1RCE7_9PEZI
MPFRSRVDPSIVGQYKIEFANCFREGLSRESYRRDIPPSRWFSRGWTYQEEWLSSRTLYVGLGSMGFTCASIGHCVYGQRREKSVMSLRKALSKYGHYMGGMWAESVYIYCDRYLTAADDRLPAMSGIAGAFSNSMGDGYLAGIWKSDILRGVLWSYIPNGEPQIRSLGKLLESISNPETYIAPSWSWAGHRYIQFELMYTDDRLISHCQATGSTTVHGNNKFGRVTEGYLLLTGRTWDIGPRTSIIKVEKEKMLTLGENMRVIHQLDWTTDGQLLRGNFKLILLASYYDAASAEGESRRVVQSFGLILHKWESTKSFVRVGTFKSEIRDVSIDVFFRQLDIETVRVI